MAIKPAQTQVCPETFTPEAIEAAALAIKQFEVGKHARLSLTDPWRHWELNRARAALTAAFPLLPSGQEEIERLRAAMQEACDLLAGRKHGNSARSPGHNARLCLQSALKTLPIPPKSGGEK